MATKAELEKTMFEARTALDMMNIAERREKNAAFIGACFKTRNSYSDGETWWLYSTITGMEDSGELSGWSFEDDAQGDMRVRRRGYFMIGQYNLISKEEFQTAWEEFMTKMRSFGEGR